MDSSIGDIASTLYNERFERFGRDLLTVGWSSKSDQLLRFEMLFRGINLKGKTVLDVGCGFGDLVPFLDDRTCGDFHYIGIDVAERLIEDAKRTHCSDRCNFLHCDVFFDDLPKVDFAVLSGALSLRIDGVEEYAKRTMKRMNDLSREASCLNFLTKYVDYELEKNQHYQPEIVFSWARELTSRVNLYHDYPLYEFTVQLFNSRHEKKNNELLLSNN